MSDRRRQATGLVLAALLAGALTLAAPGRAEGACEADYCVTTNQNGTYTLVIPAGAVGIYFPQLADCTWEVEADFGDGSPPAFYEFSASQGLAKSHTFPEPGVYTVLILVTNGRHGDTEEPCPDIELEAIVTFPEPASEPPPQEPPAEPPTGDPPGSDPADSSGNGTATPGATQPQSGATATGSPRKRYWRRCGAEVLTHGVGCRRGRKVARQASRSARKLAAGFTGPLPGRAAGFKCRLRRTPSPELACRRRGGRRVLAPLLR